MDSPAEEQPLRILVVDDSVMCRKMVSRLLREEGRLDEAIDGHDAVRQVLAAEGARDPYHVLVMDSAMPNQSGPAATEELRAAGYAGVILGLTGNALPEDIEAFVSRGANAVMLKPLDVGVLLKYVADARRRFYPKPT